MRVSQPAPAQRLREARNTDARPAHSSVSDTTDLLAISAGVAVSQTRETMLDELKHAYRSGALQPEPGRIAERLMEWGFSVGPERSL